jgi:hypothetical protein
LFKEKEHKSLPLQLKGEVSQDVFDTPCASSLDVNAHMFELEIHEVEEDAGESL